RYNFATRFKRQASRTDRPTRASPSTISHNASAPATLDDTASRRSSTAPTRSSAAATCDCATNDIAMEPRTNPQPLPIPTREGRGDDAGQSRFESAQRSAARAADRFELLLLLGGRIAHRANPAAPRQIGDANQRIENSQPGKGH